jgi:indolepyruvate decarboxylase
MSAGKAVKTTPTTIGQYLIRHLEEHGVRHVFGLPGDYILSFFGLLEQSSLKTIVSCDEQGAGFAADAYARVAGLSAVCVTYGVGGLKIVNSTAQAYAERSPVIVISGAPGVREQAKDPLLHHKVRGFDTQRRVFEQITVASVVLSDPQTAFDEIDEAIHAALAHKRPVYIELPRDMVHVAGRQKHRRVDRTRATDRDALKEAVSEATAMINAAKQPLILASVEIHRLGLHDELLQFAEKTGIPIATTLLGKSVVRENIPLFIGVYEGEMGIPATREYVESSDCVISLGVLNTDLDTGLFTTHLNRGRTISANIDGLAVRYHQFVDVPLPDFMQALLKADIRMRSPKGLPNPESPSPFQARPGAPMTVQRLFQRINTFLDDHTVVIAEPGDALFGAADLMIHNDAEFLAPAYYTSLGFAVPACVGAQLARPDLRPLVLVGDGAFQMTGMELSMAARYGLNPIVIILDNHGYGTERPMLDGPFNDVQPWAHQHIPALLGAGQAFIIRTEDELDRALTSARKYTKGFSILSVQLGAHDISPALKRLTESLGRRVAKKT